MAIRGSSAPIPESVAQTKGDIKNDHAPPAYGEIYGEIHGESDGVGTTARVTDDGRVDIRINQLNRRLSQIFAPAVQQYDQVETPLQTHEEISFPPTLNIVMHVVGLYGEVQAFVATGKSLKARGHRVRVATHTHFRDLVLENGLEFFSIGGDPARPLAYLIRNPLRGLLSGDINQRRRDVAEYIQGCWRSCYKTGDGMPLNEYTEPAPKPFVADCIIANPQSLAHIHCAEKLGIPLHMMSTTPVSPTQAFPHPLANVASSNADPLVTNYLSYATIELLSWQGVGEIVNRFRKRCLGLEPVSVIWVPGMLQRLKIPHTYCWSQALIPKPKDWGPHISISGFNSLSYSYSPASDLQAFLHAGRSPVYIHFDHPDHATTELVLEALKRTGQRAILAKGFEHVQSSNIFLLATNVPYVWLFNDVSCVVHHGSGEITAASITAGVPSVGVPVFGEHSFWAAMIARAGAGPDPIPYRQLTANKLANAIHFSLMSERLEKVKELAGKIALEQGGSSMATQSFHHNLDADRLRCMLIPSRPAAWRIRRSQVRLSALAASTLIDAKLLDLHELRIYRPREYQTDDGPVDPISGSFTAFVDAVSNMTMGLVDVPTETYKAIEAPIRARRQQSQTSVSTNQRSLRMAGVSPSESLTSFSMQDSLGRAHTVDDSASILDLTQSHLSRIETSQSHSSTRTQSAALDPINTVDRRHFNKDYDMLRPTTAHGNKGVGRLMKALIQAPMEITVSLTKGSHNVPKLWGDDTVRPHEKVSDFKTGMQAVGKEFGYGFYDGITGLFTQPWQGAQKEGAAGFAKGFGKGVGGFVAKPTAALVGIPGYMMKGVHKEMQNVSNGNNVHSQIIASRRAQGYEEWIQSSELERQEVIEQWRLLQKYSKKKQNPDDMLQDALAAHRRQRAANVHEDAAALSTPVIESSHQSLPRSNHRAEEREIPPPIDELSLEHGTREEREQEMIHNLMEERRHSGSSGWESNLALNDEEDEEFDRAERERRMVKQETTPPSYDPGHLAGTTKERFQILQKTQPTEKTTQEKTEDEIVMEYVKKQSLMEMEYRNRAEPSVRRKPLNAG